MMEKFRANPPKTINGSNVVELIDIKLGKRKNLVNNTETAVNLESSNVLQFITEDGTKISARPSGTEPKIKFYVSAQEKLTSEADFDKVNEQLTQKINAILVDLGVKE
jgi:phosphoglucomutase